MFSTSFNLRCIAREKFSNFYKTRDLTCSTNSFLVPMETSTGATKANGKTGKPQGQVLVSGRVGIAVSNTNRLGFTSRTERGTF